MFSQRSPKQVTSSCFLFLCWPLYTKTWYLSDFSLVSWNSHPIIFKFSTFFRVCLRFHFLWHCRVCILMMLNISPSTCLSHSSWFNISVTRCFLWTPKNVFHQLRRAWVLFKQKKKPWFLWLQDTSNPFRFDKGMKCFVLFSYFEVVYFLLFW